MFPALVTCDGRHWFNVTFNNDRYEECHVVRNNDPNWLAQCLSSYTIEITHHDTGEFVVIDRMSCTWRDDDIEAFPDYERHPSEYDLEDIQSDIEEYVKARLLSLREHDRQQYKADISSMLPFA